jgi:uncharacterized protein (TIGR02444 family)
VCLLLWRLWALDRRVDAATLRSASVVARDWEVRVVAPLRTIRRRLATPTFQIADAGRLSLREAVKASELAAERVLLESLDSLTPTDAADGKSADHALFELTQVWSRPAPVTLLTHLAAAAASVTGSPTADPEKRA